MEQDEITRRLYAVIGEAARLGIGPDLIEFDRTMVEAGEGSGALEALHDQLTSVTVPEPMRVELVALWHALKLTKRFQI
jgi:hypothetical protein